MAKKAKYDGEFSSMVIRFPLNVKEGLKKASLKLSYEQVSSVSQNDIVIDAVKHHLKTIKVKK